MRRSLVLTAIVVALAGAALWVHYWPPGMGFIGSWEQVEDARQQLHIRNIGNDRYKVRFVPGQEVDAIVDRGQLRIMTEPTGTQTAGARMLTYLPDKDHILLEQKFFRRMKAAAAS